MRTLTFARAIDDALGQAMTQDRRIVLWGEDVPLIHRELLVRFGPTRVRGTPISEAPFLAAGVGAAMAGLRPVVEIMMIDFLAVAMDALVNHAAKTFALSGGRWPVPLVVRASAGAGYGDGGQHGQCWWSWLAHIPGLSVVVPSTPADAGGLMIGALEHGQPVVFLEHKLLAETWLEFLGRCGRSTVSFDVPAAGAEGDVPKKWGAIPLGKAELRRSGRDVTLVSVGVGVHRCLEAAGHLEKHGVQAGVVDLRSVSPLDRATVVAEVTRTGRLVVVDEDFKEFGLAGELAASLLEEGKQFRFARVCTEDTTPYARPLEDRALPNVERIVAAARSLE